ncbi:LAGLIDADG family homing endonuclease [Candidatus Micrarchaeota archaeon]|nr:LAGLIDADG family homing endonuclease [Candidatus Micrarchaeota archaeon]
MCIPTRPVLDRINGFEVNPQLFYLAGAMRDGTFPKPYQNHYEISIAQNSDEWIDAIKEIFLSTLKVDAEKIKKKPGSNRVKRLVVYSRDIYSRLSETFQHPTGRNLWNTPAFVKKYPELQKWYVQGFFDAEGEIAHVEDYLKKIVVTKPKMRIILHQSWKDEACPVLIDLKNIIENKGIRCGKVWGPKKNKNTLDYDLPISGSSNVLKFYKEIGTSHPEKNARFKLLFDLYGLS